MNEENIKNMVKESYKLPEAPAGLWSRIEQGISGEKKDNIVDFAVVADIKGNTIMTTPAKKAGWSSKLAIIGTLAACLALCCFVAGRYIGLSDKKESAAAGDIEEKVTVAPDSSDELRMNMINNTTADSYVSYDAVKEISILVGDKSADYTFERTSWVDFDAAGNKVHYEYSILNPLDEMVQDAESCIKMEPGRWVTLEFGDNVPDSIVVTNFLYDEKGEQQWSNTPNPETPCDINGSACSFRIESDIRIGLSSNSEYYKQCFYNGYVVECSWGECKGSYFFLVRLGETEYNEEQDDTDIPEAEPEQAEVVKTAYAVNLAEYINQYGTIKGLKFVSQSGEEYSFNDSLVIQELLDIVSIYTVTYSEDEIAHSKETSAWSIYVYYGESEEYIQIRTSPFAIFSEMDSNLVLYKTSDGVMINDSDTMSISDILSKENINTALMIGNEEVSCAFSDTISELIESNLDSVVSEINWYDYVAAIDKNEYIAADISKRKLDYSVRYYIDLDGDGVNEEICIPYTEKSNNYTTALSINRNIYNLDNPAINVSQLHENYYFTNILEGDGIRELFICTKKEEGLQCYCYRYENGILMYLGTSSGYCDEEAVYYDSSEDMDLGLGIYEIKPAYKEVKSEEPAIIIDSSDINNN